MFESGIDLKLLFGIIAAVISVTAYIPYLKGMIAGRIRPHLYTWLIWTLTTGTAVAGLWYGKGGWATVSATIGFILTFLFFLLSFRYGTKNITRSDTIVLAIALGAIALWWQLDEPLLAIVVVSLIDLFAYIPTYRKSWEDPWSEAILPWMLWILYGCFLILALENYNPLTLTFILTTTLAANLVLIIILAVRRRIVSKPVL